MLPSVGAKRLFTPCLQKSKENDYIRDKGQDVCRKIENPFPIHLSSEFLLITGPTEVAAFSRDWLHLKSKIPSLIFPSDYCSPVCVANTCEKVVLFLTAVCLLQLTKVFLGQIFNKEFFCNKYLTKSVSVTNI